MINYCTRRRDGSIVFVHSQRAGRRDVRMRFSINYIPAPPGLKYTLPLDGIASHLLPLVIVDAGLADLLITFFDHGSSVDPSAQDQACGILPFPLFAGDHLRIKGDHDICVPPSGKQQSVRSAGDRLPDRHRGIYVLHTKDIHGAGKLRAKEFQNSEKTVSDKKESI